MNKVVMGFIPQKINYVYSASMDVNVGCKWDFDAGDESKTENVFPTFPADQADPKMINTAIKWAKVQRAYIEKSKLNVPEPTQDVVNNDPITNIKILSVESRGNNGRAYKALVGKYYVDMREDVVLDTMLSNGVDSGGILKGEFVWAKIGPQMKLVRVGSELHNIILEYMTKKDLKPLKKNELVVGGVYQTKKKEKAIFLGFIDTIRFINKFVPEQKGYSYSPDLNNKSYFEFKQEKVKKEMLFLPLYNRESSNDGLKLLKDINMMYRINFNKSHNFIEIIDKLSLGEDIVGKLQHNFLLLMKDEVLSYVNKNKTAQYLSYYIQSHSKHVNMSLSGTKLKDPFDLNKYLLFS